MEKPSTKCLSLAGNKTSSERGKKLIKKSKSFLLNEPPNPSNKPINSHKFLKNKDSTPLRTRDSINKENVTSKDFSSLFTKNSSKLKINGYTTFRKKNLICKKPKKYNQRGISLIKLSEKPLIRKEKSSSKTDLKQDLCKDLQIENKNKLRSPSAHPSPQNSHRTPDSTKIVHSQNLPIFTEKKSKIPEVGYYCKRFSLFDKNKSLYIDQDISIIDKNLDMTSISKENRLSLVNKLDTSYENISNTEDFPSITKVLSLDNLSDSPNYIYTPNNYFVPVQISKPHQSFSKITNSSTSNQESLINPKNKTAHDSFLSPTKVIQVYNSPEPKILTPDSLSTRKDKQKEPKAPKKLISECESPGSFIFSLSSSSSEDNFINPNKNPFKVSNEISYASEAIFPKKDEEIQTDLIEMVDDLRICEGLKLIAQFSDFMKIK
jgi:hypothetical protein